MKESITSRQVAGRWFDVIVREDGSITFRQVPDLRPDRGRSTQRRSTT